MGTGARTGMGTGLGMETGRGCGGIGMGTGMRSGAMMRDERCAHGWGREQEQGWGWKQGWEG